MPIDGVETFNEPRYAGLRMTAEEYLSLPPDGCRYEFVDGRVVESPEATPRHQLVVGEIFAQLFSHATQRGRGIALYGVDAPSIAGVGRELVYHPDVSFVRAEHVPKIQGRITVVPDLLVEVISLGCRSYDTVTKRADYEAAGVGEYWIVAPQLEEFLFLRLIDGKYAEAASSGDLFESEIVPGFRLDLRVIRAAFGLL